jgi:hypothetical protein
MCNRQAKYRHDQRFSYLAESKHVRQIVQRANGQSGKQKMLNIPAVLKRSWRR